jgi:hypothetical protein
MNDTVRIGMKVYGIDAADRAAYKTLRQEAGFTAEEANVITTLAVLCGAAGPDAHVEVTKDYVPVPSLIGNGLAMVAILEYIMDHPAMGDQAAAFMEAL